MFKNENFEINITSVVYPWAVTGDNKTFVRGWAIKGDTILKGQELCSFVQSGDENEIIGKLRSINGNFSIILVLKDKIFIAVDHLRSLPLFYYFKDRKWHITDHLSINSFGKKDIEQNSLHQLSFALETIGSTTLIKNVRQLQVGEYAILHFDDINSDSKTWWKFEYSESLIDDRSLALKKLEVSYSCCFDQLIKVLGGRTAVVPLSGGHDSRFLIYHLWRKGYRNIIAYSYGRVDNSESYCAKKVANSLEIPFYFINYDREGMRQFTLNVLDSYLDYSSNLCSIPCIQECYALSELKKRGVLGNNSVFIPGYSGDFLQGSHISEEHIKKDNYSFDDLRESILKNHFCEVSKIKGNKDKLFVINQISGLDYLEKYKKQLTSLEMCEAYEKFDFSERQAKFIINAVRTYEFFGFEWLLPFFDISQFECWTSISPALRFNRSIFKEYETMFYDEKIKKIPFADEIKVKNKRIKSILSKYSIFPWTENAHYLYNHSSIKDYFFNLYGRQNRSLNYWVYNMLLKFYRHS